MNQQNSNPNDFKVVDLKNSTDFDFTPDMGCMYDSRPISGIRIPSGIAAGETVTLPYHVGHRLAVNLAKAVLTRQAPSVDAAGIPTGVPLWDPARLEGLKNSFLTDKYTEARPVAQTETDRLMERVEAYKKLVENVVGKDAVDAVDAGLTPAAAVESAPAPAAAPVAPAVAEVAPAVVPPVSEAPKAPESPAPNGITYQDKQEVIAALEALKIPHDKRKNKADLEKLLPNAATPPVA